jgi:choline dehydrogenase-like flavoprotein
MFSAMNDTYDYIVCGAGSAGSVVAARLAEHPDIRVLLIEAGGVDDAPSVEVLGGSSSINAMVWARGHKHDWDHFAFESGDMAWGYESILRLYQRIEDWHGEPDDAYRGLGGPVFVQPAPDPSPIAPAMIEGARSVGIPRYENPNGRMMEGAGGAALADLRVRDGQRLSAFDSYVTPRMDQPNLTVLTSAVVTRVTCRGTRATGVEILHGGIRRVIAATMEIVLSLGTVHTPKVLMHSGIGDAGQLRRVGIPIVQHLPGVGQNFQDHIAVPCAWEYQDVLPPRNNGSEATFTWKSDPDLDTPDLQTYLFEAPPGTPEPNAWTLFAGVVRTKSRGAIRLTSPNPTDPVEIYANHMGHPDDLKAAVACVELCREIGNSTPLRPFTRREIAPGNLRGSDLIQFVREQVRPYSHASSTAKMGRDAMAVVDSHLRVYGIHGLRIADASIMPRVTTGNTMAPCMIIGERAAGILRGTH